jgi:hypothetical protein
MEVKVFPIETLRDFSTRVFLHSGVPEKDAMQAADVLACADLRGSPVPRQSRQGFVCVQFQAYVVDPLHRLTK